MQKYIDFINEEATIDGLDRLGQIRNLRHPVSVAAWRAYAVEAEKLVGKVVQFLERGKVLYKNQYAGEPQFKPVPKTLKCTGIRFDKNLDDRDGNEVLKNEVPYLIILDFRGNPHIVDNYLIKYYGKPVEKVYKELPDAEKWWFSNSKLDNKIKNKKFK